MSVDPMLPASEATKTCPMCQQKLPLSSFGSHRTGPGGRNVYCRACVREKGREWREANPESDRMRSHRHKLKRYKMTAEQYAEMFDAQGGRCLICGGGPEKNGFLPVDHDHDCCGVKGPTCGRCVRGLLCHNCNRGVGYLGDDPERMAAAIAYVEAYRAKRDRPAA